MTSEASVHPHVASERAELFSAHDGGSTEMEYLELLRALVGVCKPQRILETGAFRGYGTYTLAKACQANGFGRVISLEQDVAFCNEAISRVAFNHLSQWVRIFRQESRAWLSTQVIEPFQFAFFDSGELDVRLEELHLCLTLGWLGPGAWFAIHDTSRVRSCDDTGTLAPTTAPFWDQFTLLQDQQQLDVLEFPLSRGMVVGQVGGRW